jgi:two-component system response regulator GlrR
VSLLVPPLSERREDVPLLASYFLNKLAVRYRKQISGFAPDAMDALVSAAWPGNVRQLINVVEQAMALCTTPIVPQTLVQKCLQGEHENIPSFEDARRRFEREYLIQVLKITNGNVTHAARLARRNRTEFYKLLQRNQLDPGSFKAEAHV